MVRILVLVLAAVNLLYWGWSQWIKEEEPHLVAPVPAVLATSAATKVAAAAPPPCTTVGPLQDDEGAMEVEQLLRDMQLTPSRRSITKDVHEGWWVYLDTPDAAAQARALRAIRAAGLRDAVAMPDDPAFRISVGMFKEEAGARSRAEAVRALGLVPVVGERLRPETTVWFEMPGKDVAAVDMARMAAEGVDTATLQLRACLPEEDVANAVILPGGDAAQSAGQEPRPAQ